MIISFLDFHNQILIALHENLNLANREVNKHSSNFRSSLRSNHFLNMVINYFTNLVFIVWIYFFYSMIYTLSSNLILLRDSKTLRGLGWFRRKTHYLLNWRHTSHLLMVHLSVLLNEYVVWSWSLNLLLSRCDILSMIRIITSNRTHSFSSLILDIAIDLIHPIISLHILINELNQIL